jgi:hypothetical protein
VPKIDSFSSIVHHHVHAKDVPVMCDEFSSNPAWLSNQKELWGAVHMGVLLTLRRIIFLMS